MNNIFSKIIFIIAFFKSYNLFGQSTIVTYTYEHHYYSNTTINKKSFDWIDKGVASLIFNDSISFQSRTKNKKEVYKSFENLLNPPARHYTHYFRYDNNNLYKVMFIGRNDSVQNVIDTITKPSWVINDTIKYYLNYKCKTAYTITPKLDTVFIMYAIDIAQPFGPYNFIGAPGLVVEAFDTKSNLYIIAKRIEQSMYQMNLPKRK